MNHQEDLEAAKGWLAIAKENNNEIAIQILERFFPELRESEDERIRKAQLDYWRSVGGKEWYGVPVQETITWLEKQAEQKPTPKFKIGDTIHKIGENTVFPRTIEKIEDGNYVCNNSRSFINIKFQDDYELVEQKSAWNEKDEKELEQLLDTLHANGYESFDTWLKSLKDRVQPQPKQEWSEEDDIRLDHLIGFIQKYGLKYYASIDKVIDFIDWLKSIKPNHWKPSEEQMNALDKAKNSPANYYNIRLGLQSLYNDLLKL